MFYKDIVFYHFNNPQNLGNVPQATHSATLGDPTNALIKLTATIKNNTIKNIAFKAHGGLAIIACMSLLTQKVKGKTIEEALTLDYKELSDFLQLEPEKIVYAMMATDLLKKLLNT